MNIYDDVREFHVKFGVPIASELTVMASEDEEYRWKFLREEGLELRDALITSNRAKILDALVDIVYVAAGTALWLGIPAVVIAHEQRGHAAQRRWLQSENTASWPGFENWRGMCDALLRRADDFYVEENPVLQLLTLTELSNEVISHAENRPLPFWEAWSRVHAANMQKVAVRKAGAGAAASGRVSLYDVVKPAGWTPADLEDLCE